jgi:hypothetical protein
MVRFSSRISAYWLIALNAAQRTSEMKATVRSRMGNLGVGVRENMLRNFETTKAVENAANLAYIAEIVPHQTCETTS